MEDNKEGKGYQMRNSIIIGIKANARYTCQECGSTELIQAHHEIPDDDDSLVVLCAECHSKKHPDVPKALFFSTNHQPYWHNKSASSLAKDIGVHPRSIIRVAKQLEILPGELVANDKKRIIKAIHKPKTERNQKIWDFWQKGYRQVAIANMFKMKPGTVAMVIFRERKRRGLEVAVGCPPRIYQVNAEIV